MLPPTKSVTGSKTGGHIGNTINTASRMESNSEPMEINISEKTFDLVKNKFNFAERILLDVKGKGEMKMFFVR